MKYDKKNNRLYQIKRQKCGMNAMIIRYGGTNDIDVLFTDGTIAYNRKYESFIKGVLDKPHLYESRIMNNGMTATIIAMRNVRDIDIQFSDGAISKNIQYIHFKDGTAQHPFLKHQYSMSVQEFAISYYLRKLGFIKIKKGEWKDRGFQRYELDFYHPRANIAIEYDGRIHAHTVKKDIDKNNKCKMIGVTLYRLRDPYLPILNDGGSINYCLADENRINHRLIDCKRELEEILNTHQIAHDNDLIDFHRDADKIMKEYRKKYVAIHSIERLGEERTMTCGRVCKIIEYFDSKNITVQFLDNGAIAYHKRYTNFVEGRIADPSNGHLNETRRMSNGELATLIKWNDRSHVNIQFADGTIAYNRVYQNFKKGTIRKPK